jgi:protein involved in polysaccharide export with SLBB domain
MASSRRSIIFFLIVLSAFTVSGQVPTLPAQMDAESKAETDLVHLGDLIDVDVVGSLEFDWRGKITPEGFLDGFDKVEEPIRAVCRSEAEIAGDIVQQFSKTLRDPQVVVRIVDRSGRAPAIVDGAVKTPARFRILRPVFLSELIVKAGGITDGASGEVNIFRPPGLNCAQVQKAQGDAAVINVNQKSAQTARILLSSLLKGVKEANPEIMSGDIVTIAEAFPIYIIGGVNNPRQLSSREQITLSKAISSAGGLAKDAAESDVMIFRRSGGESKTIKADLGKINDKQAEDISLKPYDIVDVGQKGRERKKFRPVISSDAGNVGGNGVLPIRIID